MSVLNINDLPCEMIMEIMQLLDVQSLKNATLTCKLWNNLIESACRWSFKLITDNNDREQKVNFMVETNRKFNTVEVRWIDFRRPRRAEIYEIFLKHGINVVKLTLREGFVKRLNAVADLLHLMPNLQHAVIRMNFLFRPRDVSLDRVLPELKKLKKLEISTPDLRLIKCFRKAKLTTMTIWEKKNAEHFDCLVEFLSSQDTLKSLTVVNYVSPRSILVEMGKLDVPIKLRLSNLEMVLGELYDNDNFLRFVKSQKKTLKQLELKNVHL